MSYVVKTENKKPVILEKDTGLHIYFGGTRREINALVRKLNLGSGFQGFTPTFFARQSNVINS